MKKRNNDLLFELLQGFNQLSYKVEKFGCWEQLIVAELLDSDSVVLMDFLLKHKFRYKINNGVCILIEG